MKVICIKQGKWKANDGLDGSGPKYLEECTVIGDAPNRSYYFLKEYEFSRIEGIREGFLKKGFIPLSSIDETEMVRDYKTEKV